MQIQPVKDLDSTINQISFILRDKEQNLKTNEVTNRILEKARAKLEASNEGLKKKLLEKRNTNLARDVFLLESLEADIYNAHQILEHPSRTDTYINIAELCKQMVQLEQNFAKTFPVQLDFTIANFGMKDISPLVTKNFPVKPDEMTGPFFTVFSDVKKMEFLLKKLLDISVFLASQEKHPYVTMTVERGQTDTVVVNVKTNCTLCKKKDVPKLFHPYYDELFEITGLRIGSGLEGFLARKIGTILGVKLEAMYESTAAQNITFACTIKRKSAKN
jgi:hypothetical protein